MKLFFTLSALGILGVISVMPYVLTLQGEHFAELPMETSTILALSVIQSSIFVLIATGAGLFLAKKVGFKTPLLCTLTSKTPPPENLKKNISLATGLGILAAALIVILDVFFTQFTGPLVSESAPIWQGLLASLYGGITEEILLRLFLMTLIAWALLKVFRKKYLSNPVAWTAIIVAAILFGIGHLPTLAAIAPLTPLLIFRTILLNAVGGIIFGWLYWRKGLEFAMIAHFSADIVLHVLLPALAML